MRLIGKAVRSGQSRWNCYCKLKSGTLVALFPLISSDSEWNGPWKHWYFLHLAVILSVNIVNLCYIIKGDNPSNWVLRLFLDGTDIPLDQCLRKGENPWTEGLIKSNIRIKPCQVGKTLQQTTVLIRIRHFQGKNFQNLQAIGQSGAGSEEEAWKG